MDAHGRQDGRVPLLEELIHEIIAMVPFPEILNGRLLLKSWLARFHPIWALDGEEEKLLAAEFQKQVREISRIGEAFTLFVPMRTVCLWLQLTLSNLAQTGTVSFIPESLIGPGDGPIPFRYNCLALDGVFLYGNLGRPFLPHRLVVANILTRNWRELSPHAVSDFSTSFVNCIKFVSDASSECYKLILSSQELRKGFRYFAQIYDSKLGIWIRKNFVNSAGRRWGPTIFAYFKRVLYGISFHNLRGVAAFNVEGGTTEECIMPSTLEKHLLSLADFPIDQL